jgi:hypothetical protein
MKELMFDYRKVERWVGGLKDGEVEMVVCYGEPAKILRDGVLACGVLLV